MWSLCNAGDAVDTVIIVPEPGELKSVAKDLLSLADSNMHVEYVMWPETGFRVPDYLADRFVKLRRERSVPAEPVVPEIQAEAEAEVTSEPVKRKPGRPKKVQEGQ